jgi:hypothetical protein
MKMESRYLTPEESLVLATFRRQKYPYLTKLALKELFKLWGLIYQCGTTFEACDTCDLFKEGLAIWCRGVKTRRDLYLAGLASKQAEQRGRTS